MHAGIKVNSYYDKSGPWWLSPKRSIACKHLNWIVLFGVYWQQIIIGLGNCLASARFQAIV